MGTVMLCLLSNKDEELCTNLTTRVREGMPMLPSSGLPHQQGMMSGSKGRPQERTHSKRVKEGDTTTHSIAFHTNVQYAYVRKYVNKDLTGKRTYSTFITVRRRCTVTSLCVGVRE